MNRVVITGLGCITPIGNTVAEFTTSLFAGTSGIAPFTTLFPEPPTGDPGLRFKHMAEVKGFDPYAHMTSGAVVATERSAQLGVVAARQAALEAALRDHHAPENTAIVLGCSTGGRHAEEPETKKLYTTNGRVHPLTVPRSMASSGASQIAIDLGITGPTLNISTACASSTHAIGLAFQMVRSGLVTAALTGGHEAPLTFGFLRAWDSMRVVSPTGCRPFSADRDGMTLGEGAAILILESLASAKARNATIYAEILGFGMSSDAHHITQPKPEGATAAIHACFRDAARTLQETDQPGNAQSLMEEVGYINAHGTGTVVNDQVESAAIHAVFGARAPHIPVSSTKSLHGHSIGASGAIEAVATALALHRGQLPATATTQTVDPTLNLDLILNAPRPTGPTVAISNSLAFGGLNAVIALRTFA
ncbi:beta-ketoacyl-[acyl-carrier-protein] synthase family protein [Granulicella sp. WH15]|uniref:beta-ketoacyl-[acyl-carrier-protein] synthase family protein n=1 Tax=Granulicella sp. WH15 TaxID=2602070 RepID=UPI001366A9B2|nr:beta-ketoacyl-[acyl-carrier-protein] synthase family protein [Granulicella sp. WH15]QHN02260.1 beta-ketoacyl-[acyl-carrier-protein] synthase family protein [Granulicella sp. WH15]